MAKTFKVGDKVRILDVSKILFGGYYWKNGDITEVATITPKGEPRLRRSAGDNRGLAVTTNEFNAIELVDAKPTKKQRIEALEKANADLVTEVEALKARIEALEKAQEPPVTTILDAIERYNKKKTPMSANQRRKAVIERAKAFVADVEKKAPKGCGKFDWYLTKPEYHINKEKRVVTVLVKGAINPKLYEKAIARCAPGDVFNEHIGKAIALAKAYGLDCPKEFTDAPQPDRVVAGMVVRYMDDVDIYTIEGVYPGHKYDMRHTSGNYYEKYQLTRAIEDVYTILDDTEAQYE